MDIKLLSPAEVQTFFIILARVAGFLGATPVFSAVQSPNRVKMALVLALSLCLFPVLNGTIVPFSFTPLAATLMITVEVLLGAILGLIARFIFVAVQFGATIISFQMGFSAANIYDPTSRTQLSLLSQFQNIFALLIFLAIDGHHIFFKAMVRSFTLLPPGRFNLDGEAIPYLMQLAAHMFVLGVQFSAPILVVLLLTGLILGILARIFPQLNVFMLSFPINVGAALTALALTLNIAGMLIARELEELGGRILHMLELLNR